jgi:hypothetical protein
VVSEAMAHRYGGGFFAAMGLSGFIEVVGLSLYAIALWKALGQPSYGQKPVRRREAAAPQASPGLPSTQ